MKVKRYVVESLPQAMDQIKVELGKDAVILHTKTIKIGGLFGFFGKEKIEVIAAVDKVEKPVKNEQIEIKATSQTSRNELSQTQTTTSHNNQSLISEVNELKRLMINLMIKPENKELAFDSTKIKDIYNRLLAQGVKDEVAASLIEKVIQNTKDNNDEVFIVKEVKKQIINILAKGENKEILPTTKIVHFVGPTGVGKTTTIAKLAAEQVLKHNKRIAFITADTYRIAAVEQLKTYAEILNAPIEVVFSTQDTKKAIDKLKDYDLIFMDTAGRNYHNELYISELNNILSKSQPSETFLVISLTHKYEDLLSILEHFKKMPIDKLLFTKFDETLTYGTILNIISMTSYKGSYITNGQNVPDDIEIFDEEKVANVILGV